MRMKTRICFLLLFLTLCSGMDAQKKARIVSKTVSVIDTAKVLEHIEQQKQTLKLQIDTLKNMLTYSKAIVASSDKYLYDPDTKNFYQSMYADWQASINAIIEKDVLSHYQADLNRPSTAMERMHEKNAAVSRAQKKVEDDVALGKLNPYVVQGFEVAINYIEETLPQYDKLLESNNWMDFYSAESQLPRKTYTIQKRMPSLEEQGLYCPDIIVDYSLKGYEWLKTEDWQPQGDGLYVGITHHYYTRDKEKGCFDSNGVLKIANLNPYAMGTSEMTDLMLYALLIQDYAQNKYSIKSAGAKTQQYIRGELGLGPMAKRKQDPAKAYVNYLKTERAERNARNSYERRRANQASQRAALGVFNALYSNVDAKGDEWIGKLKRQHNEELHLYKVERLSPVSFKLIFLDDNGNYTHSLKFTAVQSGKFNFKWKASVLPNDASFKLQPISYGTYLMQKNADEDD